MHRNDMCASNPLHQSSAFLDAFRTDPGRDQQSTSRQNRPEHRADCTRSKEYKDTDRCHPAIDNRLASTGRGSNVISKHADFGESSSCRTLDVQGRPAPDTNGYSIPNQVESAYPTPSVSGDLPFGHYSQTLYHMNYFPLANFQRVTAQVPTYTHRTADTPLGQATLLPHKYDPIQQWPSSYELLCGANIRTLKHSDFPATGHIHRPVPIPAWCPNVTQTGIRPPCVPNANGKITDTNFRRLTTSRATHTPNSLSVRETDLQRHISHSLGTHGVCVIDNFVGDEMGRKILQETNALHSSATCRKGESLGGRGAQRSARDDVITWIDGSEPEYPSLGTLCRKLDLIVTVGRGVTEEYDMCGSTKAMVAKYPGNGAGYQLHIDNPTQDGRCLTCLYYINKDWDINKMGGSLRLHARTTGRTANISPVFDRIVIFYSDGRNPHEVLPTYNDRYAITLWYFDREERMKAVARMISTERSRRRLR